MFKIQVDNTVFHDPKHPQLSLALEKVHAQHKTICLCRPSTPLSLVVKHYNGNTPQSHYGVALWPDTGLMHDHLCYFFDADYVESEEGTHSAFEELGSGLSRVYLATALKIIEKNVRAIDTKKQSKRPTVSQPRASEHSLLLKLWRNASLNIFKGKQRSWYNVTFALLKAAERIQVNADGEPLSHYLLIGAHSNDAMAIAHNKDVLERAKRRYTRLFVIGRIKPFGRDKTKLMLPFRDFAELPRISIALDQLDGMRSHTPAIDQFTQSQPIVITTIEPTKNEWWSTVNIHALTLTVSDGFIPISSPEESLLCAYLEAQSRTFLTPLIVEGTHSTARPPFLLLDTPQRTHCDIVRQTQPTNQAALTTLIQHYASRNQRYWCWQLNESSTPPNLPEQITSAAER